MHAIGIGKRSLLEQGSIQNGPFSGVMEILLERPQNEKQRLSDHSPKIREIFEVQRSLE